MLFTENSGIFISFFFFDEVKDNIHKHFIVKKKIKQFDIFYRSAHTK